VRWQPGSDPDTAGGAYSTPQDSLARLRALLLQGEGRGGKGKGGAGGGEGREGQGKCYPHFWRESYAPAQTSEPTRIHAHVALSATEVSRVLVALSAPADKCAVTTAQVRIRAADFVSNCTLGQTVDDGDKSHGRVHL